MNDSFREIQNDVFREILFVQADDEIDYAEVEHILHHIEIVRSHKNYSRTG